MFTEHHRNVCPVLLYVVQCKYCAREIQMYYQFHSNGCVFIFFLLFLLMITEHNEILIVYICLLVCFFFNLCSYQKKRSKEYTSHKQPSRNVSILIKRNGLSICIMKWLYPQCFGLGVRSPSCVRSVKTPCSDPPLRLICHSFSKTGAVMLTAVGLYERGRCFLATLSQRYILCFLVSLLRTSAVPV